MKTPPSFACTVALLLALALAPSVPPAASAGKGKEKNIRLTPVGSYSAKVFDRGAAEIVAHDPATQRLFVVNGAASAIDVLGIADPSHPTLLFSIDVTPYGEQANSVAVRDGVVAAAVQADPNTDDPGKVVFFDASGAYLDDVTVGALPDICCIVHPPTGFLSPQTTPTARNAKAVVRSTTRQR